MESVIGKGELRAEVVGKISGILDQAPPTLYLLHGIRL